MRPRRVLAIAWRDLRSEFSGRRFGLLGIIFLLLAPAVALEAPERRSFRVSGQVPERVATAPGVYVHKRGGIQFFQDGETTRVYNFFMHPPVREALDAGKPAIELELVQPPIRWPQRSLFFALIAASTLTGSVSSSIGGERTHKTLQALLSASVSKLEIVVGKWLAWSGFGAAVSLTAAAGAVLWGKQAFGPWVLALPFVPALTVALGLWLVRRTDDVIAGTSVSLRVLPAVLGGAALAAVLLTTRSDILAALLPLGGVMLAAGDLWQGSWMLSGLAMLSSGLTTGALLVITARDLEEEGSVRRETPIWTGVIRDGTITLLTWWALISGPVLWGWAGNAAATEHLQVDGGLWAAGALLLVLSAVAWARHRLPTLGRPTWHLFPAGLAVAASTLIPGPTFDNPWLTECASRFSTGLQPGLWFVALIALQEVWFRGFLQRGGWMLGVLVWTLAVSPTHPVAGLISGLALAWCARGGLTNALLARLLAMLLLYALKITTP